MSAPVRRGEPLAILHLNTERTWRGGEQQLAWLLDGLARRGHRSLLIAQPASPLAARARAAGHEVRELPMRGEVDLPAVLRLAGLLRRERFDLVHVHTSHAHSLGALAAALRGARRPPVVLTRRVDFSIFRRSFFGLNRLKYVHGIARTITVSRAVRDVLLADGLPPERLVVVHSGIDPARIEAAAGERAAARAALGVPGDHALIGNVAALVDHKGQRYLVDAIPEVLAAHPRTTFAIVGEGPLRASLEAQARARGVRERVRFTGFRDDVPALLAAFDLFVMPSHLEALGTSVLDAMAAGLPVVATRAGGLPEAVVEGETGLLCPPRDPAALARALGALLADPARARRLGEAGRRRVHAEFSDEAMVEGTVRVYREVLGQGGHEGSAGPGAFS